ncbi:helix-turn-helix domain-containing protein [Haladaptatus pallidirubidus]|uniref:DNA-binding protein n=1 Tax=Haladaptatus pallidirubidus TaxID=1008152 RepID=A0AAV3UBB0_9EURY|nr:helix-turn-helix domain-containing protein [Haladaptatus pallidirubidus]
MTATVVEVEIPPDEFALSQSLAALEDLSFEIERVVAHDDDEVMPFVWISSEKSSREDIETALAEDPSVKDIELLANLEDEWLYQMGWVDQIGALIQILVKEDGTILAAMGNHSCWNLRIVFPEREALSRTYDYCENHGLTLDVLNIYRLDEGRRGRFGLTEDQQDTLTLAYDHGYYQVPRKATADDLAEELGISHQAISERLRRGHGSLVENALILGEGAGSSK